MDPLNETVLLETKITLFNLLIRETSHVLCYERLLNMTYVAYKNAFFREMQFWSHCYTVVSYQALFRLSVYKIPAVYLSGAKNVCFCTIRDFGSPTNVFKGLTTNGLYVHCSNVCFDVHNNVAYKSEKKILMFSRQIIIPKILKCHMINIIYHSCPCIIEFIKLVVKNR